ncbi:adenosine-deaminase [Bisporella sp. PMI_857]|nr:adenosine-deaminase [Bisporella sp. PMI_857]
MSISGDKIAQVVLDRFNDLPAKAKPLNRGSGLREWVPLSGIVAQGNHSLTCLAIATGMKCLPHNKLGQAQGIVLHDWHAEVLAIRSLNRFLLNECYALATDKKPSSEFIRFRTAEEKTGSHFQPFALQDGIDLHMYCSEAPCGDASMELTMAAQEDSTPWEIPQGSFDNITSTNIVNELTTSSEPALQGRSYFSLLGAVRRKPSRLDAPPTLSKSCSDKLALKQCTSLLSSSTSLLISPSSIYLSSITLPSSQHSSTACTRAFSASGRMSALKDRKWGGGYSFQPFELKTTDLDFMYSRRQALQEGEKLVSSNIAASWVHSHAKAASQTEVLIGGMLQGRKKFDILGSSRTSRRSIWKLALDISALVAVPSAHWCLRRSTYNEMKNSDCLKERREVKGEVKENVLKGWARNTGDDDFAVDTAIVKIP